MLALALAMLAASKVVGQDGARPAASASSSSQAQPPRAESAEALYMQLRTVGLDKSRVYKIREASLERAACHITLDDGTIAFTQDVAGHVTGAFFEGDGEVLLVPPDRVERGSMALFTGAAILEENFVTAYLRFNDDTFAELKPFLRPADDAQEFVSQWDETARNLAEPDALRLLLSFSRFLPSPGQEPASPPVTVHTDGGDRLLHARMQGRNLGSFDVYFDSDAPEPIWAGQKRTADGTGYYNVWTSFAVDRVGTHSAVPGNVDPTQATSNVIKVSAYRIRVRVRPPSELDAEAWLQVEVEQGGQRALLFELSRFLRIRRVEADGAPVEFIHNQALEGTQLARRGNDLVAVIFPQPLRVGQKVVLHFEYGGEVLSDAGEGLLYVGARGTWYPNRGLGMSNFDLEFHFPAGWTLVATGKQVDVSPSAATEGDGEARGEVLPGEQVNRWVSERRIPLAGFNLGKYSRAVAHAGDVVVETYAAAGVERSFPKGPPQVETREPGLPAVSRPRLRALDAPPPPLPSPARNAQAVADLSAHALEFFARHFGPYPYSSLAVTQIPGSVSQGWPSLIFLSSFSFLTSEEKAQLHMSPVERTLSSGVIAHETAHQWWGDLVTSSSYRDQWLVEALANYSSLMLLESENPSQFHAALEKYRDDLLVKNKEGVRLAEAGPVTLGARLSCSHFPAGYEAVSYGRGTWLFHMLRNMMLEGPTKSGPRPARASEAAATDTSFFRALRKIRDRYQGRSITTREVLQVFEEELPASLWYEGRKSLDWFYQGWVNGSAVPHLDLRELKYTEKPGSTAVSGTILQNEAPKDLVTRVPVYAALAGKTILLGMVFADGPETSFHLSAPAGTRKVVLDPYHTVLTRLR